MTKTEIKAQHRVVKLTDRVRDLQNCVRYPEKRRGGRECLPQWRAELSRYRKELQLAKKELRRAQQWRINRERIDRPSVVHARNEIKEAQATLMDILGKLVNDEIEPNAARRIVASVNYKLNKKLASI